MIRMDLGGAWRMTGGGFDVAGTVPGSVYSFLLAAGKMKDPFYRENEVEALSLMENDYVFSRRFSLEKGQARHLLCCDGLDTLCRVELNGKTVAETKNMHRRYVWDVTDQLLDGENEIALTFFSPTAYCREQQAKTPTFGCKQAYPGFPHLRKSHCMMGWDWGPVLPDAGIWRDIYLLTDDGARITDCRVIQRHEAGRVFLTASVKTEKPCALSATLTDPDGNAVPIPVNEETEVASPRLWWPNGLGEQALYTVSVRAASPEGGTDVVEKRVGLRTLELVREKDAWGESYYHRVNGVPFFAMGADYIPEDAILSRITRERTKRLLSRGRASHFNALRVWGGGFYPNDFFFDLCDEMGIVVFLDLMTACCMVPATEEMHAEMEEEARDNLLRVRHHACIALISGNNEIEANYGKKMDEVTRPAYLRIYEERFPAVVREVCPEIAYVPSSPTSGGHFDDPEDENRGDSHYWDVWHRGLPFTAYRKHFFRYLSEFGFEALPDGRTIAAFTLPEDRNLTSRVMDRHQRRPGASGKMLAYMSDTLKMPSSFDGLIYASQVLQAHAIRYGVEHLRRNRGRCMGALYWQFNDVWRGASWSSVDYDGRLKALQYAAKRFFAPVLLSCEETGETEKREETMNQVNPGDFETRARLSVQNESPETVTGRVIWSLRDPDSRVLDEGETVVTAAPFTASWVLDLDFHRTDAAKNHLTYAFLTEKGVLSHGSTLFTVPKHYAFSDPKLSFTRRGNEITVRAEAFASWVEISSPDADCVFSDNFFDMEKGEKTVRILEGDPKELRLRSLWDLK